MENREAIEILSRPFSMREAPKEILDAHRLAISALEKQEQNRWHSVAKEGNPPKSGLYIVVDNSKLEGDKPHTRYFNAYGDNAFWSGWRAHEVIAWKEITSEPYTEEEDERLYPQRGCGKHCNSCNGRWSRCGNSRGVYLHD